jgi:hypothetical protein
VGIYRERLTKLPRNAEALRKIIRVLDKKNCVDNDVYFKANENLYKLEPNPRFSISYRKDVPAPQ